jgi:alpha-glucosidase
VIVATIKKLAAMALQDKKWWQTGVVYQVYPRSFQDSNGDGVGDLKGISSRLDHLQWLGIDAVWLSPIYPSPMADFGYDIADYTGIHPLFGNMADFDALLKEVHGRGMKLLLDLVPNHTSDQHPWFLESKSSRDNPKRDWYIWKDPSPEGGEPNNWLAMFGGKGWEWDETTQQYYYHAFLKEQPDLNWRNPEVQQAMFDVMRFWLAKGVDGFRVDVMWHMVKDKNLRNNPVNPEYASHMGTYSQVLPIYSTDQPEVHDLVHQMRKVMEEFDDERVMIGEIYLPVQQLMAYYGVDNKGAHLPFNFQLLSLPWNAAQLSVAIDQYEGALPEAGWPNWVLSNHDQHRIASRVGVQQARVAAMLLLTLRGTPTIYYGDEIGMQNVAIPFEEVVDPQGLNMPDKNLSRDPSRTPMQWDNGTNAGFSETKPWLRLSKTYQRINVAAQKEDPYAMLTLYRKLIQLRRSEPSLAQGAYIPVFADNQMLAFKREEEGHPAFLVVLNLTHLPCYFRPDHFSFAGRVEIATIPEIEGSYLRDSFSLDGDEGLVIRLDK